MTRMMAAERPSDIEQAANAVEYMDRKLTEAKRCLIAAAISAPTDLVIYDTALQKVDMYTVTFERDESIAAVRVRVRPK